MPRTTEQKMRAGFALALALAMLLGGLAFYTTEEMIRLGSAARHTRDLILELGRTQSALTDAETGQRGYLISGDPAYLAPYTQARADMDGHLRALAALTDGDLAARRDVTRLPTPVGARMAELAATITLRRARGFGAARRVVLTDAGRADMDVARGIIGGAVARGARQWGGQMRRRGDYVRATQWLVGALIGAEFALLSWAYGLARRDAEGRARARAAEEAQARELEAQHEELLAQQAQLVVGAREMAAANARLEWASLRFEELYQALPTPCFCHDAEGRIMEWNRAFETCYAVTPARVFQRPIWEAISAPDAEGAIRAAMSRVFAGEAQRDWEMTLGGPAGGRRHLLCSTVPMRGPEGQVVGGLSTHLDITERKRAEEALRVSEARLRAFHDITAATEDDPEGKVGRLLRLGCREFGLTTGLVAQADGPQYRVRHAVSPDGGSGPDSVCDSSGTFCRAMIEGGGPLAIPDARAQFGVGACFGAPLQACGADWGALCFTGPAPRAAFTRAETDFLRLLAQWIGGEVERARSREQLIDSEERFRSAIGSMHEGFMVQDAASMVLLCNQRAEQILGVAVGETTRHTAARAGWRVIRADGSDFPREERPTQRALATGQAQPDVTLGVERAGGGVTWLSMNAVPLYRVGEDAPYAAVQTFADITERRDHEGQIVAQMAQIQDYTVVLEFQKREMEAQKREVEAQRQKLEMQKRILERTNLSLEVANSALETLATLDGLTGLKNHRTFQESLEAEVCRSQRYGEPLSLIMLDVDRFKQYNDTYGHPAGDEVLRTVGLLLEQGKRETDFVARYGGEEFAVFLPNTDGVGARVAAERLRAALARQPWPERPVTASLGVSTLTPLMADRAALIASADAALYRAKEAGRDRAVHAADPGPASSPAGGLAVAPSAGAAAREGRRRRAR